MSIVTCVAPVNIAVIKYWGKRDEELILPLNDSVSITLGTNEMQSKTTVMISSSLTENKMWLNGKEVSLNNHRLKACLEEVKKRSSLDKSKLGEDKINCKIHICSENNFPTAAGLASSAAGYACLVYALAHLYEVKGDITSIARLGSGSACRSLMGGFVRWKKGEEENGNDSVAEQVVTATHWPTMRVLILVVNSGRKKVSSTSGMQQSVLTSELLKHRVSHIVPRRTKDIIKAIKDKDFETFAEITMRDSNQFHSVCLDTFPPNVYMNDTSHAIVDFVHAYNKSKGSTRLAYTFDAGPNACLFLEEADVHEVLALIKEFFPPLNNCREKFIQGLPCTVDMVHKETNLSLLPRQPGSIKYIIHTKIGNGPEILTDASQNLLNEDGLPKNLNE